MTAIQRIERAIAAHAPGAEVDARDEMAWTIDAPVGKVFQATGSHTLSIPFENAVGQRWTAKAAREVIEEISMGVDPCDETDCDYCEERRAE